MTLLDEAGLVAALDPDCVPGLLASPLLDASGGPVKLRALAHGLRDAVEVPALPDGVRVRDLAARGDVPPLRVYEPELRLLRTSAVLWIHGGGLIAGKPEHDDLTCAQMAAVHACPVISVDYRLAPEAPYPAGLEDCFAALVHVLDEASGFGVERLVVAGASAGGGLTAALGLLARDRAVTGVVGLLCVYPMLDDRPGRPSVERATAERTWHRDANAISWRAYLGDLTDVPIHAAPGRASVEDLRGLPPVFVDVGTLDPFFDEDVEFARRLALAGVAVELVVTPGACHGSEHLNPAAATSRRILAARRDALQRMLLP